MLSKELNKLITETGPGTSGGALFRKYWQPVALRRELPAQGEPMHVRILSEDLVLFREETGAVGLLGLRCPHRGADLSYGRVEEGGIRCLYHGWLFSRDGTCLERPNVPQGKEARSSFKHVAYPCIEVGDAILAYLGEGLPPPVPNYEFLTAPDGYRFSHKFYHECNYLQANEGNLDPSHTSFLHRNDIRPGAYARIPGTSSVVDDLFQAQVNPVIDCEATRYGLRIYSMRRLSNDKNYVRVTNFLMPNIAAIAAFEGRSGQGGYTASWHVPIDDTSHFRYDFVFQERGKVDPAFYAQSIDAETDGFSLRRTERNRYMQNRAEMKGGTFSGMGTFFPAQDAFAVQSQGPIQDRSKERLGPSDAAIVASRKMLIDAIRGIENGVAPPNCAPSDVENWYPDLIVLSEAIDSNTNARDYVMHKISERRAGRLPMQCMPNPSSTVKER